MSLQFPAGWQEDSAGIYSRALDELELYCLTNVKVWSGSGHTASAITVQVGLSIPNTFLSISDQQSIIENSFSYAWKKIRYHCPLLASSTKYDSSNKPARRIYQVPESKSLDDWMNRTFTSVCLLRSTSSSCYNFHLSYPIFKKVDRTREY
jgi:hypothetical protein